MQKVKCEKIAEIIVVMFGKPSKIGCADHAEDFIKICKFFDRDIDPRQLPSKSYTCEFVEMSEEEK